MCVTATAKRRRRQAVNRYRHVAKRQRSIYRTHTNETYDRRLAAAREKRLTMQARKRKR